MSEILQFEPTEEQFGPFWKYISDINVTDVNFNGSALWITDLKKGKYKSEEEISMEFVTSFTHMISNCVNKQFNNANKVLEADTKELRISMVHNSVAVSGITICIRKSPCFVRNTIKGMIEENYCSKEILQLLINCVLAKMNFIIGGEIEAGKTERLKFLMQFIPKWQRVITIEDSLEIHYPEINPGADAVELRVGPGFTYTDAIKTSLRQSTDWLVLSEARSSEVTALLQQWSTGTCGLATIHLDDLRKLPDRIQNMMNNVNDADRMENQIYSFVNIGILIRCYTDSDGSIKRMIEQLCFYSCENNQKQIYMIVKEGKVVSKELPPDILKKFEYARIPDPFCCDLEKYIKEGK